MPEQIAFGEKREEFLRVFLLAVDQIIAEPSRRTKDCAFLIEEQRCDVVDDRAEPEAAADKGPGRPSMEASSVKLQRPLIGKIDRQRADQRAGGESENAGECALADRDVKP